MWPTRQQAKHKVVNRFGEENARVSYVQSIDEKGRRNSHKYFQLFVSVVFLFAPEVYFRDLRLTYDNRVTMEDWKPFFDGVREDWQGIVQGYVQNAVAKASGLSWLFDGTTAEEKPKKRAGRRWFAVVKARMTRFRLRF